MPFKMTHNSGMSRILFGTFLFGGFILLASGLTVAGPAAARADQGRYGGQVVLSTTSDPKSFNDIIAKERSTTAVTSLMFEGLTTVDPFTLKVIPHLAESWEVGPDGREWTFHLRPDVKWFDGHPFTADDVIFTFNQLIYNPDIPSSSKDIFTIDGQPFTVVKLDRYTVRFVLPVKFAPFLRGMSQAILPKHILEESVKNGSFNFTWGIDTPPENIIGTGPYRLVEYDPGQKLVFERNPRYWKDADNGDQLPYIDRVIYLIVQSLDIELLKFLEGTTDVVSLRGMDYGLLKPLEEERDFTIYDLGPDMGSNFLTFNLNTGTHPETGRPFVDPVKQKWFQDPDFRRAVAHAVDKEQMISIVKNGLGYPQDSPMGPGTGFFHCDDVRKYPYDLDRARDILTAAGYKDRDGDGVIEDREGQPVEFNLFTNAGNTERIDIASIIRYDLEKIGMRVNFQAVEFNVLVSKMTSTFEWDMILMGLTGGVEPHFGKNVWTSSGQLHLWHPRQEIPATEWEAEIDELFSRGVQELDEDKRKVIYDEFQQLVARKLPVIYTVLGARLTAVRNKFGNMQPTNYGGVLHNLEELYVYPEYR